MQVSHDCWEEIDGVRLECKRKKGFEIPFLLFCVQLVPQISSQHEFEKIEKWVIDCNERMMGRFWEAITC